MIKTRVTEMLGIEYPILAGPMGYISTAELVAAVSNAGGLGILVSMTSGTTDDLRQEIRKVKSLTNKPFGVNVTLMPTIRAVNYDECFAAALEEGVKIIETSGRSPEPYLKMIKDAKAIIMHRATRTRDLKTAERIGVDIATIVGYEAAGHPGIEDIGTFVRVPAVVDAIKIPVIAAGGIVDARGFVAALALGAEGVLMGTRFMISQEAPIHPKIKEWLAGLAENDTMIIEKSIKNEARVVKTDYSMKLLEMEQRGCTLEEILPMIAGRLGQAAYKSGDCSGCTITVGQAIGLVHDIPTIKEIIDRIVKEAEPIMQRLNKAGVGSAK